MIKIADFIVKYADNSLNESELIGAYQELINDELITIGEGAYGLTASSLLRQGHCLPAGQQSPEEAQENYLRREQT